MFGGVPSAKVSVTDGPRGALVLWSDSLDDDGLGTVGLGRSDRGESRAQRQVSWVVGRG